MRLEGKAAIVTGAGQGIGRAIAMALADDGCRVVVSDLVLEKAEAVTGEIRAAGRDATAVAADVADLEAIDALLAAAIATYGPIDILVNNVGAEAILPSVDVDEALWDHILGTGVKAAFFTSQRFARHVMATKRSSRAKIINIASVGGHVGTPNYVAYGISKAGVIQLTRGLGVEWIRHNINVNAVSPGVCLTPRIKAATEEHPEFFKPYFDRIPAGRPAKPEDIAGAVAFLASAAADHIVGHVLAVDGGALALHPGYVWPSTQPSAQGA